MKMRDFGGDGPCHSDEQIKMFWTDVLRSLRISLQVMAEEARNRQKKLRAIGLTGEEGYIPDLEERIVRLAENPTQP